MNLTTEVYFKTKSLTVLVYSHKIYQKRVFQERAMKKKKNHNNWANFSYFFLRGSLDQSFLGGGGGADEALM